MKKKTLALISNHPAPYRDPFLGRIIRQQNLTVDVFSLFEEDSAHSFWKLKTPEYRNIVLVTEPRPPKWKTLGMLMRRFVFSSYDYVCWPGFLLNYLNVCMLVQALLHKEYIISADTVFQRPISRIAFWIKKFLIRHAKFIFVPGEASKKFFMDTFSLEESKICIGCYALDGISIEQEVLSRRNNKTRLRAQYGFSDENQIFLMVANMIPTRHYPITVEAFRRSCEQYPQGRFIIVGKGPELERMKMGAKDCPNLMVIPGVSFDEMLSLYAISDIYVHGGTEPASTALVIGAISNLPLLSSYAVGCSFDCLQHKRSGYCVSDYLSIEDWKGGFDFFFGDKTLWQDYGKNARELSRKLDVENAITMFETMFK